MRNVPHDLILPKLTENVYKGKSGPILRLKASEIKTNFIVSSCGSAFVTKFQGRTVIVTAFHVTQGMNVYQFYTEDRKYVKVLIEKIVFVPQLDATVFFVSYVSAEITPLEHNTAQIGKVCTTTGYPAEGPKTTHLGKLLSSSIESSAVVDRGMSGGPVISNGKVVGIISAKIVTNGPEESVLIRLSDIFDTMNPLIK